MLTWWAVGIWAVAAGGGLTMAALFLRHEGMRQSEREAIGPLRVFPHVGLAAAGLVLWIVYAVSDSEVAAWVATALIGGAFAIAGTFLLTRDQHRRRELARLREPAAGVAGAAVAPPAEAYIPIWLASVHGLLGAAALILVLLERAGVGGS
ncbi:MAG TPA: hypothetical protein VFJ91_05240 [Gaiellaceae bacterium]|nr:hypothetical protein [Gaiellaceae bacterium]